MSATRTFEDTPANREQVPLLAGIVGPSGGGKTFSALELATGIQSVVGGDIGVIDTEAKRALHYADRFKFRHLPFGAPFNPGSYLAAVDHFINKGVKTVVVDSMSHEHEGPGGVLEMHEAEVERMAGNDYSKRERVKMLCWQKPKAERRRLINSLLQMNANFIFCFRAKEKMKMVPGQQPVALGWMPIAGEEFVYEMTMNCLLLPKSDGVPTWETQFPGERQMMKLPDQFRGIMANGRALSRDVGRELALWAKGGVPSTTPAKQSAPLSNLPAGWDTWTNEERGENRARAGVDALKAWWTSLTRAEQNLLKAKLDSEWKPLSESAT
jgi:hypothetical protein